MIGGSGEKKTLRTVARHADGWNTAGTVETMARKVDVLAGHCADAGRDIEEIEFTLFPYVCLRDDPEDARRALRERLARHGEDYDPDPALDFLGPEERVAELWRPFLELGFTHVIADLGAPFDHETIERLPRLRTLVGGA
jgi:alkanesulfonate monooxygenase SsuD/methylene tetrahydromethanopterin reductase-like flavin-dependent oxidoreductase (luciferase family)